MAPRRARRRSGQGGVNRRFLTQREKLTAQRLPVYQGPSPAPQQGPRLAIPRNLVSEASSPTKTRPAPGPDIWNPGSYQGGSKPPVPTKPQARDILALLLGLPRALTTTGIVANVMRPTALGDGTLEGALRRGESIKQDANLAPKPKPKPAPKKTELSAAAISFDRAFAKARAEGKAIFTWRGKRYNTRYAGE